MSTDKLDVGGFGDEVARLHEKLKAHGFDVSPEEVRRKFFGPATRDAVRECQTCHGLEATGEVNEATVAALSFSVPDSAVPAVSPSAGTTPEPQSPIAQSSAASKSQVTATEGALLGMEQPNEYHLPFQPSIQIEAQRTALSSLLSTSPVIASSQLQEKVIGLHAKYNGPSDVLWSELRQDPEVSPQAIEEFRFTLELGRLTRNNVSL